MARLFSKTLKDTDIRKRMAVPAHILGELGIPQESGISRVLRVRDSHGQVWRMTLTTRADGYLKPEFLGDWRKFVQARELQTGDLLSFYQLGDYEDDEAEYRIEVCRNTMLMGANVTGRVA